MLPLCGAGGAIGRITHWTQDMSSRRQFGVWVCRSAIVDWTSSVIGDLIPDQIRSMGHDTTL